MDLLRRDFDMAHADVRVEFGVARAEFAHQSANRATAEQWAAIAEILDEARRHPEVFVDPELPMPQSERVDFAQRAAAADLAVRLGLAETTVRAQAFDADTLRARLPRLWSQFRDGAVAVANARTAADLVRTLPDSAEMSAQFDEALAAILSLAPVRFRLRARVLRENIHSVPLVERAQAAAETRDVWIENDVDGMANLCLRLPAATAHCAFARIQAAALSLSKLPDETRLRSQLRADAAADILLNDAVSGAPATRASVGILIPVMTALGLSDEPATLDGYGPIDAETARRLTAHAPSFFRLLTDPVTSALLDIDRTTYRPPADLKRWLEVVDQTCQFTGCGRLARNSDLDHTIDYQFGGPTSAKNLAHLCRHHHRLKHMTKWTVERDPVASKQLIWTSPTGHQRAADPPPF